MIEIPAKEDLDKGKDLHDRIKSHPFRMCPQIHWLDEYHELFESVNNLFGRYVHDYFDHNTWRTVYKYHAIEKEEKNNNDSGTYTHYVDVWSNPTIALMDESMHDFRGIYRNLKVYWKDDCFRKFYLGKYIETSEIVLQLLHSLIDGNIITEISFPQSRGKNYTFYKYVRNPKYNNNWTLEREI